MDLGGPIAADKAAWFYGAYNHFKIDKQVCRRRPGSSRLTLGCLRQLHGARARRRLAQNNTFDRLLPAGRKQKPKRGLSTLVPPESILAQDSVSWMATGRVAVGASATGRF